MLDILTRIDPSKLQKVVEQPGFEGLAPMDWNGQADVAPRLGVYVVATVDSSQSPTVAFQQPSELLT